MKTPRMRPGKLRLNQKFALILLVIVLVPVLALAAVLFGNMRGALIEDRLQDIEAGLLQTRADVAKVAEMCGLTAQFFIGSQNLTAFLAECAAAPPDAGRVLSFYREDIASLEKLVNANPYLYQARVYQPNAAIPEIMPVLYHQSRMERLGWAGTDWQAGGWRFDYSDNIFDSALMRPTPHIMCQVVPIEDRTLGRLGVLEVAVRMDEVLPGLFAGDAGQVELFTAGGEWYGDAAGAAFAEENRALLDGLVAAAGSGPGTVEVTAGGRRVFVSSVLLEPLGGCYLTVVSRAELTAPLAAWQNLFLLGTALTVLALALVVNLLVKALLGRFYRIVDTVAQVRGGDLDVQMPALGGDEIGLLADEIGRMLSQIRRLMQENVDRQLAAKNAELRAMQSQINAHFIYNVLESIKMQAEMDGHLQTSDAVTHLGRMLRYSMHWTGENSTLEQELASVENYLALINLRYDYTVALDIQVPPDLLAQRLPKMTLQPLVENAVTHGIEPLAEDTAIAIRAVRAGDTFTIEVTDQGIGIPALRLDELRATLREGGQGEGLGLKNVHDRLVTAFGPASGLELSSRPGVCTRVRFRIPLAQEGGQG